MKRVIQFCKLHIVTLAYCMFFTLALLPTIFSFFNKIGVFYKIGVLLLFAAFLTAYIIKKKIKINYRLLIIPLIVLVVFSLYYIAILPNYFTFVTPDYSYIPNTSITIVNSLNMRLGSIITVFNLCFFASLFLIISPSLGLNKKDIICFSVFVELITFIACLYSLKEIKSTNYETSGLMSFLGNKNTFGEFLLVAIFVSLLSFAISKKIYLKFAFLIISIIFMMFVFLSRCSTAIVMSIFIFLASLIFFIINLENLKRRYKILIFVGAAIVVAFLIVTPYLPFTQNTKLAVLIKGLYDKIFSIRGKNFLTIFTYRGKSWSFGSYLVTPKYIMLGYGESLLEEAFYRSTINYFTTRDLTNAYLTVFDSFGIIGTLLYAACIVYLWLKYYRSNDNMSDYLLAFLIVYLFYGVFESLVLFESFSGSLILTPILVVPATYMKIEKNNVKERVQTNG